MPIPDVFDKDWVTEEFALEGNVMYVLERFGGENCYNAAWFAILPEPSDEVAIEQEQEAIIYQR